MTQMVNADDKPKQCTCWGPVTAAVIATFAAVTPGFTVGALTDSITKDLGTSTGILGVALACFFAFTAIGSPFSVRLAKRLPTGLQLAISTLISGLVMFGIGDVSQVGMCVLLLIVGGCANSLVQPAVGNILNTVPQRRLSFTSGLIQAALGAGTLPAFLLLRFVATPYGRRAAFTVGGALVSLSTVVVFLLARNINSNIMSGKPNTLETTKSLVPAGARPLYLWSLGAAMGSVGVTGVSSFFIPIATSQGYSISVAASFALAISGLAGLTRIVAGLIADQRPNSNVVLVIWMMLLGMIGLITVSFHIPNLFLVGSFVLVIGLYGWNGLLVSAAVRLIPESSAKILGWLQMGFFTGATFAPLVFGLLMSAIGIRWALLAAAVFVIFGALLIIFGERFRRKGELGVREPSTRDVQRWDIPH
ncbi:MFS transporter [Alicyclobacillus dauci]|uniref:MFS transporter n=1 Tax=Alicyclobacillus dauci TaxID=1475485 RepID=A0ABY6Z6A6_9BACL|nr:MFS transporter [Alicyclobacillus dauci]WAH38357.1 MFS transporter [Alicyclobacillus dauci]